MGSERQSKDAKPLYLENEMEVVMPLVLTAKTGEYVELQVPGRPPIRIKVIRGSKVRMAIEAERDVQVIRSGAKAKEPKP